MSNTLGEERSEKLCTSWVWSTMCNVITIMLLSKVYSGSRFVISLLLLKVRPSRLKLTLLCWSGGQSASLWSSLKQLPSRNVVFKAARLGDSIFDCQSEILGTEAVQVNSPSHEEDFDDVGCNADLYASRQDAFQGSSRSSYERSQQQSDPHCFQSLSLD